MCVLRLCKQNVTLSLQCESQILGSRTVASFVSTNCAGDSQTQPRQTVSGPAMQALPSWILLTVMQMRVLSYLFTKGSISIKTTPETQANSHHSLEMRPQRDYNHRVMLNNCARWSPVCQCLTLTSLRDSHSLPTRHSHDSVMH